MFRFAIANLKASTDPTYALRGALLIPIVTHRAAITDEAKLGALMTSIDSMTAGRPFGRLYCSYRSP